MNAFSMIHHATRGTTAWTAALGIVLLGGAPVLGQAVPRAEQVLIVADEDGDNTQQIKVWALEHGVPGADHRSIQVRVENGEPSVTIDGEAIPADRIVRRDGRVIVLDEDGNEIEGLQIGVADDAVMGWTFHGMGADAGREPTVMLGIHLGTPGRALEKHLALAPGTTTMITALHEGLPAHAAGLGEFDIITKIDGRTPADPGSLRAALADLRAGDRVELTVIQTGRTNRIGVALEAWDAARMEKAKVIGRPEAGWIGQGRGLMLPPGAMPKTGTFDFDLRVPNLDDIIIAPGEDMFFSPTDLERRLHESLRGLENADGAGLGGGMEQLDRRLAELERTLRELVERAEKRRPDDG